MDVCLFPEFFYDAFYRGNKPLFFNRNTAVGDQLTQVGVGFVQTMFDLLDTVDG